MLIQLLVSLSTNSRYYNSYKLKDADLLTAIYKVVDIIKLLNSLWIYIMLLIYKVVDIIISLNYTKTGIYIKSTR